jgi:preprotein translocase subunit SecG
MENVLLVVHMIVAVALIAVILMQKSAQDGGGLMGGGSTMGGLFTARGSANLLTRTTAVLATIFIVLSLVQGVIAARKHGTRSLVEQIAPITAPLEKEAEVPAAPAAPEVPVSK